MGEIANLLFGAVGQPIPGVPTSDAVARKLGLDEPLGRSAQFGMLKSSYSVKNPPSGDQLYGMMREEMVNRLAEQ